MTGIARHPAMPPLLALLIGAALLALPLRLPIGANFWDLYFHLDAAYRIGQGQVPHADFFSPAGSLPFYLLAGMERLAPAAAPLLQAQYGVGLLALLILLVVTFRLREDVSFYGWLLTAPFALFVLLPFNASSFFPAPGADGIGLYNRQTGFMLFVFVAALFTMRGGIIRAAVLGLGLAALFFLKINGFAVATAMLVFTVVSQRLRVVEAAIAVGVFVLALSAAQIGLGLTSVYMQSIGAMLGQNSGGTLGRLMTLASVKFDVLGPLLLLCGLLLWSLRSDAAGALRDGWQGVRGALRLPAIEFIVVAGLVTLYESQNTGGQEFLPLWPALLLVMVQLLNGPRLRLTALSLVLVAATALPTLVHVVQGAARAIVSSPTYAAIDAPGTEPAGRYGTKPEYLERANVMLDHYASERGAYARLAGEGQMPATILYSTPDYQVLHLIDLSRAAAALRGFEASAGKSLASIATLDSNDLLPMLLGRQPVKGLTISFDPARGYPESEHPRFVASLDAADGILAPHCPETPARLGIMFVARTALQGRTKLALSPCWDLYIKP